MMTYVFKRYEKKYMLKKQQQSQLLNEIKGFLVPDRFGKSYVNSVYLDTPDRLIIRNSIEARNYKEKLRYRYYGELSPDCTVFLEIKKKVKGVVYKRRISTAPTALREYFDGGILPDSQIMREIEYCMQRYGRPQPKTDIRCLREAFFARDDNSVRLTFDTELSFRTHGEADFHPMLDDSAVLLEVKTPGGMPLWLSHALTRLSLYPTSFSKYGTAYKILLNQGDITL